MWIVESAKKARKRMNNHYKVGGVEIFIKDRLPEEIDPNFVFNYISARVPFYLTRDVEIIYIGDFPEMREREINAFYEDGAIYVTNDQEDEMDMIEDIIHEISHSVEKMMQDRIYGDSNLEKEFLAKRRRLESRLKGTFNVPANFGVTAEFDNNIDDFLFRDVKYSNLEIVISDLFPSSYAVTSISEYWAKGFEHFFLGDRTWLKNTCPILYNKLFNVVQEMKDF